MEIKGRQGYCIPSINKECGCKKAPACNKWISPAQNRGESHHHLYYSNIANFLTN